jgi:hypothetical protein
MTLFRLTALSLELPCSYFLKILHALLLFFDFTNIGILGMMGLKTLSFANARNLIRVNFNIFNWILILLCANLALQSSTEAFLIYFFKVFSFNLTLAQKMSKKLLCLWLPNEIFFVFVW